MTDRQVLTYQKAKGLIVEMLADHEPTHRDEIAQEVLYPHPKKGGKPNKQLTDFTGTCWERMLHSILTEAGRHKSDISTQTEWFFTNPTEPQSVIEELGSNVRRLVPTVGKPQIESLFWSESNATLRSQFKHSL